MKYIVDIKGEIEGDYEIIGKYEERPQGDLISRSALKEEVKGLFCPDGFKLDFIRTIDNAPTVENITVFCETANEETLENIKKELKKVLDKLKERNNG